MNKSRPQYRPTSTVKLCSRIVEGRVCTYGDACKFSHDIDAFVAVRPPDLDGLCPIYSLKGYCRFGPTCRFSGTHGSSNMPPESEGEVWETNELPRELPNRLRKHQYDFAKADNIAERVLADIQEQQQLERERARVGRADDIADTTAPEGSARTSEIEANDESGSTKPEIHARERKKVDFRGKTYLAPLTTVGNLPFRRVCKDFGVDITCGEMAMATNLLQAQSSEWALLRRHKCEDVFGVQLAGNAVAAMGRAAQLIEETCNVDFIDINMGCPIDVVCNRGCGAGLALKPTRVQGIVRTMSEVLSCPLTVKMRMGYEMDKPTAHKLIPKVIGWGAATVTVHGRSRQQRYSKLANWDYISECASLSTVPLIGNGDAFSYEDVEEKMALTGGVSAVMFARGALVKPWIFTEVKERRHWDISSSERLEMLKTFTKYGLEHWGTDELGISRTRNFMLEWLSFLYRYVPVGLLERLPARIQERPPAFCGRDELETLMASSNAADWVKITEMLLGPCPTDFNFVPKHKANAYAASTDSITAE